MKIIISFIFFLIIQSIVNTSLALQPNIFSNISNAALPSVVTIELLQKNQDGINISDTASIDNSITGNIQPNQELIDHASGFIISKNGYILTTAHLIKEGNNNIIVKLYDGKEATARLVFKDDETDIAVIHINEDRLYPLAFESLNQTLSVGQQVISIGSPYFFENSISSGVISHTSRNLADNLQTLPAPYYMQTTLPVNPGNSGGPVLNANGKIIGMNSRIFTPTGSSIGISFAIPLPTISEQIRTFILDSININGQDTRLNLSVSDIHQNQVNYFGLANPVGARIIYIDSANSLEQIALQTDDIIITLNKQIVRSSDDFYRILGSLDTHTPIKLSGIRFGKYFSIYIKPEALFANS